MEIKLTKLYEVQRTLDAQIEKMHPVLPEENRIRKKVLATLTEVGECVNEFPEIFKFWSNKKNNYEKGLVELVDILHFLLSIGSEKKIVEIETMHKSADAADCAISLCYEISSIEFIEESYTHALTRFFEFAELLGFSWGQIESAYMDKNKINHERQANGY